MHGRRPYLANAMLCALIGAILLLRTFVPAGWMPAQAADGFAIELCAGMTPGASPRGAEAARELFEAALAGAAQPADNDDNRHDPGDQPPCAFASLTPFAPPPLATTPIAPAAADAPIQPLALAAAIGRGLPAPPPPATGPPLNA